MHVIIDRICDANFRKRVHLQITTNGWKNMGLLGTNYWIDFYIVKLKISASQVKMLLMVLTFIHGV